MANNLESAKQEFSERLTAQISTEIPFIQKRVNLGKNVITDGNRSHGELNLYVPASGDVAVYALAGPDASTSALDYSGRSTTSSFYKVTCYARNGGGYLGYSSFEQMFAVGDIQKDLVEPRAHKVASEIERDLVSRSWFRSGGASISTAIGFEALSDAAASLQTIKATGDFVGFIPPRLQSYLSAAVTRGSFFVGSDILNQMYGKQAIGFYSNAEWVNEPFMPTFTFGSAWDGVTVSVDVDTQGADTIYLSGIPSGETIKAGTPFKIDGVYEVTISGTQLDTEKWFITQEDFTSTGTNDAVKVLPIYFNGSDGYQNNVYVEADSDGAVKIASGTSVTAGLTEGHTYYVGLLRDSEAFNWTPFNLPEVDGYKNTTVTDKDITVQLVSGGDIATRANYIRLDVPYFGDIVDPRVCRTIYVDKAEA